MKRKSKPRRKITLTDIYDGIDEAHELLLESMSELSSDDYAYGGVNNAINILEILKSDLRKLK